MSDEPRYELLGLVRDDAARRLAESGEATAANWAHANDLQSLAEARYAELSRQARPDTFADLDTAHDDFLAVLDRARSGGNAAFVVRLAGALAEYWRVRGLLTEGRMWLDAALRMQPAVETAFRARALHGAGVLAMLQGDFDRARERLDEAFRLRVRLGLEVEAAGSLNQIGLIALERGELDEAERVCREALDMRRQIGDEAAARVVAELARRRAPVQRQRRRGARDVRGEPRDPAPARRRRGRVGRAREPGAGRPRRGRARRRAPDARGVDRDAGAPG